MAIKVVNTVTTTEIRITEDEIIQAILEKFGGDIANRGEVEFDISVQGSSALIQGATITAAVLT